MRFGAGERASGASGRSLPPSNASTHHHAGGLDPWGQVNPILLAIDELDGAPLRIGVLLDVFDVNDRYVHVLDVDSNDPLLGIDIDLRA
jgi:hypothetical protein